jgi:hypothetical protein
MGDKIRHLSSTSGYQNLFSAGMTMSPLAWDSILAEGSSQNQQLTFSFDDQTTNRWRQQQQQHQGGVKSKNGHKQSRSKKLPRTRSQKTKKTANAEQSLNLEQSFDYDEYQSNYSRELLS